MRDIDTSPDEDDVAGSGLIDAGVDRHSFSGEWESVWEDVNTDRRNALLDLEDIVRRMLELHGYVVDPSDPASGGDEAEILVTYAAVREVAEAVRGGEDVEEAEIGQAVGDAREIYRALIDRIEGSAQ
jgi:hypothetical protein